MGRSRFAFSMACCRFRARLFSVKSMASAPIKSARAMATKLSPSCCSIQSFRASPITAAGRKDRRIKKPNLRPRGCRPTRPSRML